MATTTDMASLETKLISIQVTSRGLTARKATIGKMIAVTTIRKTIAVVAIARKTIAAVVTIGKATIVIPGSRMTMNDIGTVPTTNRLASIDRIAGSLATTRPRRSISSATKTTPSAPIFAMIKMILIPPPICQSPPFTTTWLVWSLASW